MEEALIGIVLILFLNAIFWFGKGCATLNINSQIEKNQAIYIDDKEYRCNKVK